MVGPKGLFLIAGLLLVLPSAADGQDASAWLAQPASESVRVLGLGGAVPGKAMMALESCPTWSPFSFPPEVGVGL